jgi:1,4-dihydroxy-6-naphthoate synthase
VKLSLGYSPCPNDCFIFDALVHGKIDTQGIDFVLRLEDVESLNRKALRAELDITKLSYHAYAHVLEQYILLKAGSALGFNCGPLLVRSGKHLQPSKNIDDMRIAIPGKLTTANFLLSLAYPKINQKVEYVFSEIEEAILRGEVDAGLIIHENRFTYEQKGLVKMRDLGEYWDELIHAPIPLGGIVMKRNLGTGLQKTISDLIRKSVEFAFANPEGAMPYVRANAQEMEEDVMKKHIELYVNKYSIDLGEEGTEAVKILFKKARELNLFDQAQGQLIID